jgi:NAD(P)-dependent dehydrogenase (short-subunit alcohol dehydrogenase family)
MNNAKEFDGQRVLITGGNSGIGLATAERFVAEGARVLITGRDPETLAAAQTRLGSSIMTEVSDAGSLADIDQLVSLVQRDLGGLDVVFVNAGIAAFAPMDQINEATFDATFATNVKGPFFLLQRLAPFLSNGARIVLNGSVNAHIGMHGSSIYAASKAAFISFARTLSAELVHRGIRVNVVSPGPVATPIYGRLGLPLEQLEATAESLRSQIALGRFGEPAEIAELVAFLASDRAKFLVGTELIADGGMTTL